jgi:hypothetical protein
MNYGDMEISEEDGMRYGPRMPAPKWWKGEKMKKFLNWLLVIAVLGVAGGILFSAFGCKVPPPQPPPAVNKCSGVTCPSGFECKASPTGAECVKIPVVEPPPVVDPPLAPFCTKGKLIGTWHPYLQGIDSTWVCQGDRDFCESIGYGSWADGRPRYDCPLGPDLTEIRYKREATLGCPAWEWRAGEGDSWKRCTEAPVVGGMSCDNFDLHNVPPGGCAPQTGFFVIPHGRAQIRFKSLKNPDVVSHFDWYEY